MKTCFLFILKLQQLVIIMNQIAKRRNKLVTNDVENFNDISVISYFPLDRYRCVWNKIFRPIKSDFDSVMFLVTQLIAHNPGNTPSKKHFEAIRFPSISGTVS